MNKGSSFQRLLAHAKIMVNCGQKYEQVRAIADARLQYDAALAVLNGLAADTTTASQVVDVLRERVHGLLASICDRRREFELAAMHWEEQLALQVKSFGANAIGLVDIYVSLSKTYLDHLNKVSEAKAAAEKACEIVAENGSQNSASAIYANYYLCLCELSNGNKAAAVVALNRALAMLDANPSSVPPIATKIIRIVASEFA